MPRRLTRVWKWLISSANGSAPAAPTNVGFEGAIYGLLGVGIALLWTAAGYGIAYALGQQDRFLAEWIRMQAFFCLTFGIWLLLIAKSRMLESRVRRITSESIKKIGIKNTRVRIGVVVTIWMGGNATFIGMGFNATGGLLLFMWALCVFICLVAGLVTLHLVDLLIVIHDLQFLPLKLHIYSPARTPELRDIVSYFSFFTLLLTIAYAFACVGTFGGSWTGNRYLIQFVQLFWPAIYVPACSVALIYPHIVIHRIIRNLKDSALSTYQTELDEILQRYGKLKEADVRRANALTQLFDRFNATPDYVIDVAIVIRTLLPHLINVGIFFAKPLLGST